MFNKSYAAIALLVIIATPALLNAQQPQVVDATGTVIGDVIATWDHRASVVLEISGGRLGLVHVGELDFATPVTELYYESADCSGTPFVYDLTQSPFVATAVIGDALYAAREGATRETITFNSIRNGGSCSVSGGPFLFADSIEVSLEIDLGAAFTAPFSVKANSQKGNGKPRR